MKDFGLLIVDKPVGPTSHRVVNTVRRGTGIRKVGHAGTLDPRASGVLVLCLGAATRLSEYLSTASKRYEAVIRFGAATRTYDSEGEVVLRSERIPSLEEIQAALPEFRGEIEQVPPPYSAIKVEGKKAYELARSGEEVELESRDVVIYTLEVKSYEPPELSLIIECSAGTYIRSIAHDLGAVLSTGAFLASLRRSKAGPFAIEDAVPLPILEIALETGDWEKYVVPAAEAVPDFPVVKLKEDQLEDIRHGRPIPSGGGAEGEARAMTPDGELAAIVEGVEEGEQWHPRKVFLS